MRDPREILSRVAPAPVHTEPYGHDPEQVIDLWPAVGSAPLAVLWHGGFWRPPYDRVHLRPLANALAEAGFSVAVPEYRRIGWPAMFDDVAAALDGLPELVRSHGLEPGRTVWAGHSAGGHLALWAALRHRLPTGSPWHLPQPPDIDHVVALAACSDLALCAEWRLDDGATETMMGGTPADHPGRYAAADPAALLPTEIPVVLLHGTEDDRVPPGMSRAFHERAQQAGSPTRLVELPGLEHYALIDPLSPAWPHLLAALREGQGSSV